MQIQEHLQSVWVKDTTMLDEETLHKLVKRIFLYLTAIEKNGIYTVEISNDLKWCKDYLQH